MVTGDHLRTALSVAHACGMLSPSQPALLLDTDPSTNQLQGRLLHPQGATTAFSASALQSALEGEQLPVAVTGPAWQALADGTRWRVVERGVVFARMAPEDKQGVVEALSQGAV